MKKVSLFFVLVIYYLSLSAQNKITYAYDAVGNRVKREITFEQSQDKSQVATYSDMLDEKKIKIYPNPTEGELRVEVLDEIGENEGTVMVYGSNGALVSSAQMTGNSAQLDISSCPNGLYIMHIKIGDFVLSWKIIKK